MGLLKVEVKLIFYKRVWIQLFTIWAQAPLKMLVKNVQISSWNGFKDFRVIYLIQNIKYMVEFRLKLAIINRLNIGKHFKTKIFIPLIFL